MNIQIEKINLDEIRSVEIKSKKYNKWILLGIGIVVDIAIYIWVVNNLTFGFGG